jgi:hypothetical protein
LKIQLEKHGDRGWKWTMVGEADDLPRTIDYRTNEAGCGLWIWARAGESWAADGSPVYEWKQIRDTSAFCLPDNRKNAWGRIRDGFRGK